MLLRTQSAKHNQQYLFCHEYFRHNASKLQQCKNKKQIYFLVLITSTSSDFVNCEGSLPQR